MTHSKAIVLKLVNQTSNLVKHRDGVCKGIDFLRLTQVHNQARTPSAIAKSAVGPTRRYFAITNKVTPTAVTMPIRME